MEITIYSKQPCPYCDMAKAWFKSKNLTYTEHKVGANEASTAGNQHSHAYSF